MAQQTGAIYHQGILYSGGGGTNVTPNPQGEATDTLSTVEIDGTVYGIEGGGNLILDAQRYSLDEQVVGIWTDGKPLYEITLPITQALSLSANSWIQTQFDKDVKENIIRATIVLAAVLIDNLQAGFRNNKVMLNCPRTVSIAANVGYLVLQYTKTTDTAGSGGYQAYGFSPIVCSDTEREVGVWEDNKPLYQKTFIGTLGGTAGSDVSNYKMADLSDIDTIVSISGTLQGITPINSYYASDNYNMVFVNGAKNGLYCNGKNIGGNTYKVTIQYTKASDTAGSGEYNTLAIPNVHYSTDEQVIGTWIDGKTLYQKTLRLTSGIVTGSFQTIPLDSTYIVNDYKGFVRRTNKRVDNFNGFVQTTDVLLLSARTNGMEYYISTRFTDITELCITVQYTKTTD